MADAKGAFVSRALDKLIKDSSARKQAALQKACKAYLDHPKPPVIAAQSPPREPIHAPTEHETPQTPATPNESELADVNLDSPPHKRPPEILPPSTPTGQFVGGAATTMAEAGAQLNEEDAELIVLPLKLACESKQPKLVETALDCLHKLIAYGHLGGEAGLEEGRNNKQLTELFMMVCSCADIQSDSVVLQVIKVLLTAVASSTFQVHGECLLLAIRTCYNIALGSKNPVNIATAKATLTQMINLVFQRMDPGYEEAGSKSRLSIPSPPLTPPPNLDIPSASRALAHGSLKPTDTTPSSPSSADPKVTIEQLSQLAGDADIKRLEAALDKAAHPEGVPSGDHMGPEGAGPLGMAGLSQAERNALMVMRALCRLSMKEPMNAGEQDIVQRGKLLSLDLIQAVLLSAGSGAFHMRPCFLEAVKSYMPHTLLRACVSPAAPVFDKACSLFLLLVQHFRDILKAEIGVFFPLIVLRSLDSGDTALPQRLAVLKILQTVCQDPQLVVDIFVNYDCDLEATNLFERMVNALSRIAQGVPGMDPGSIALAQNVSLKTSSLQCLVNVLQSLMAWTSKGLPEVKPAPDATQGAEKEEEGKEADLTQAEMVERMKQHKSALEAGVAQFNLKPDKGIKLLVKQNILALEAKAVAQFLHNTAGLDKTAIGEYLGDHHEFHLKVMHAYVDDMDFKGLNFDGSIRKFLQGFRLPGEAQKIDRIMEKFAEKYCRDNPGIFKNADAAYVLAYAIIMLNTDAHNPLVTNKMKKQDFVRINASTNAPSADGTPEDPPVPVAILEEIYDRIVSDEIKMRDDDFMKGPTAKAEGGGGLVGVLNLAAPKSVGKGSEKTESEGIIARTQALFKKQHNSSVFQHANDRELARPILEAVGWPLLAAFSVTMEDGDNKPRVTVTMEGFKLGIQLTRRLGMETTRNAFLTALVRLTSLHSPREMRTKNVEALKVLLSMADAQSDCLQDSWYAVLECVSRLELICSSPEAKAQLAPGTNQISRDSLINSLTELAGLPTERIFVNSIRLPSDAIVEFFTALCRVSDEELRMQPPRVFSLQKLVEISYYNMARIRMVWSRIWVVLSSHFVNAGGHPDEKIAIYALDSLRQLGMKYLERAELANFTFQNDILKPFVVIMRKSKSPAIREMVTQCVVQMIRSKVGSIKSGWRSVFMVFTTAAQDPHEPIVDHAFLNVEQVVLEHFDQVVGDCFMDCVNCLIAFANNKLSTGISLKAVALLRICEDRLAEGHIPGGIHRPVEETKVRSDAEVAEYYWFPMLAGLSDLTSDPRPDVRGCALEVLFDLCKERGAKFSQSFWESIFTRVLFPIFDYVRHAGADGKRVAADEWLRDTCIHCLQLLCDLFCEFYKDVSFMLPGLLSLLMDCTTRPDQGLASISVAALVRLIDVGGKELTSDDWSKVLTTLREACSLTQPSELFHPETLVDFTPTSRRTSLETDRRISTTIEPIVETIEQHKEQKVAENEREGVLVEGVQVVEEVGQGGAFLGGSMMGKVLNTLLLKNVSFARRGRPAEPQVIAPTAPVDDGGVYADVMGAEEAVEMSTPQLEAVRCKCVVQLLLLSALDQLQAQHWARLSTSHKQMLLDVCQAMVDFPASYSASYELRRKLQPPNSDRPAPSLLRQEVEGTKVYLAVLSNLLGEKPCPGDARPGKPADPAAQALRADAESRLAKLCLRVLGSITGLQKANDATPLQIHNSVALGAPVLVQVLDAMGRFPDEVFNKELPQFFPHFTSLICSNQKEVRRALGSLFTTRLVPLLL